VVTNVKSADYLSEVRGAIDLLRHRMQPGQFYDAESCLRFIETNTGDPYACKDRLHMYAIAKAMLSWFEGQDLEGMKQWSYVAAKIRRILFQERPAKDCRTSMYLTPLLSDNLDLVEWFSGFDYPFTPGSGSLSGKRRNNPKMDEYYHYNTLLALRGDWETLVPRCEVFLGDVPAKLGSYQADYRFHMALAKGDVVGMEASLGELVEPKLMKRRQEEESGTTGPFICTFAVVYAKIAWLHGHQVQVSSPYVPKEWLPIAPLPKYEDAFAFMAESDDSMPVSCG